MVATARLEATNQGLATTRTAVASRGRCYAAGVSQCKAVAAYFESVGDNGTPLDGCEIKIYNLIN